MAVLKTTSPSADPVAPQPIPCRIVPSASATPTATSTSPASSRVTTANVNLRAGASLDAGTAWLSALKGELDGSVALFADMLRQPNFDPAEIERVRLGTRLPVYLPMRIDDELVEILREFRQKAEEVGIRQFFIQTHFQTPLEITPEVCQGIQRLHSAGWTVTNQLVFNVSASRRGHTAKLRQELNNIGILCYYTFSVKGFEENHAVFAPNSRSLQEQKE